MNENAIYEVIMPYIRDKIAGYGVSELNVLQAYQPNITGRLSAPTLSMFNVNYRFHGWGRREYPKGFDPITRTLEKKVIQKMETIIQMNVTAPRLGPGIEAQPIYITAADIATSIVILMQSSDFVQHLLKHNMKILRITDMRNLRFFDERDNHNSLISFDVTIIHDHVSVVSVPFAEPIDYDIKRV